MIWNCRILIYYFLGWPNYLCHFNQTSSQDPPKLLWNYHKYTITLLNTTRVLLHMARNVGSIIPLYVGSTLQTNNSTWVLFILQGCIDPHTLMTQLKLTHNIERMVGLGVVVAGAPHGYVDRVGGLTHTPCNYFHE